MTQLELAERLDLTKQAVSKWERGRAIPDEAQVVKVAEALGVTVDQLISEVGQPSGPSPALTRRTLDPASDLPPRIDTARLDMVASRIIHEVHDAQGAVAVFELRVHVLRSPTQSRVATRVES